jgi:cyclophilin family peptidyl-prolyl cis-trans isomerase
LRFARDSTRFQKKFSFDMPTASSRFLPRPLLFGALCAAGALVASAVPGVVDAAKAQPKAKPAKRTYRVDKSIPDGAPPAIAKALRGIMVPPPPASLQIGPRPRVKLVTSKGSILLELNPAQAPLHSRSFVYLAKRGYFNNTTFHRWADLTGQGGTIIQGGDALSRSSATREYAGIGSPGYTIPRERNRLKHGALVLAAARSADPNSAGSQFYITQAPTLFLDEGDGYTVFGRVVQGAPVAKKLRQNDRILRAQVVK